jgi:hypothetical protein
MMPQYGGLFDFLGLFGWAVRMIVPLNQKVILEV